MTEQVKGRNGHEYYPPGHPNEICCVFCGLESCYWDEVSCEEEQGRQRNMQYQERYLVLAHYRSGMWVPHNRR